MSIRVLALYSLLTIALLLALRLPFTTDYVGRDNDDVMRLVMVRDLLAGQGWFDTVQYRLGLEDGTLMHWSRFVDLPIAGLIGLFSLFAERPQAEAIALAVWPALLVVPVLFGMGLAGNRLGGRSAMHATLLLTALFIVTLNRFGPGSIDHHNLQLALVACIAAMLLDPEMRARDHAVAGALAAFAIAIGAETTPLIGAVCLIVALRWLRHGDAFRPAAAAFGTALALTVTFAFFSTVAPARYLQVTCDSLSFGFYALATIGGGALVVMTALARGRGLAGRFIALCGAGLLMVVAVLLIAPGCLSNPLDALDPLLKTFWLAGVTEAQSVVAEFQREPELLGTFYAPGLIGMAVCLWRIRRGMAAEAHAILFALLAVAFAVTLIQIRGAIFANMLSALPLGFAIVELRRAANADPKNLRLGLSFALLTLASVPSAWALAGAVLPGQTQASLKAELSAGAKAAPSCIDAAAMASLAGEPVGVVDAASDFGASILRHTGHRVLAAPYHRNQDGMLAMLHIGLAEPPAAEALLRSAHVTLLAFCAQDTETRTIADAAPDGLYGLLYRSDVPPFLLPVPGTETAPLRLFRVKPE